MSHNRIESVGSGLWRVYCSSCDKLIGDLDLAEIQVAALGSESAQCFDCDPAPAANYHPLFKWEGEPFLMVLDGQYALLDWPKAVQSLHARLMLANASREDLFRFMKEINDQRYSLAVCSYLHTATMEKASDEH